MKFALLLLTVLAPVLPLSAQTPGGTQEIVVVTATSPMILAEQKEVLAASSALIAASVDLRADGTARTTHHIGTFTTRIELTGLAISEIVKTPVTRADAEKGIVRRYVARLACRSHRIWDGPMASWSEWRREGYGFFPSSVVVEEVGGALRARATRICDFSPGIDSTMAAAR